MASARDRWFVHVQEAVDPEREDRQREQPHAQQRRQREAATAPDAQHEVARAVIGFPVDVQHTSNKRLRRIVCPGVIASTLAYTAKSVLSIARLAPPGDCAVMRYVALQARRGARAPVTLAH